ncbi:hypothetical protein QFW96_10795 [Saccharopolyspora sp. TS4A08]|uniref:Uncharacterized protein n=1 Tax=Saccharopolyspora ipomoeae TaxID=3042027 RepID=A0ABT6PMP0_9PSEU|nr:hypothetical protein [Saccharopolyspora sp. TS4A08]MDI2029100.1 hypothetical protein [Saccharopolyspora sp. TS4A08]
MTLLKLTFNVCVINNKVACPAEPEKDAETPSAQPEEDSSKKPGPWEWAGLLVKTVGLVFSVWHVVSQFPVLL